MYVCIIALNSERLVVLKTTYLPCDGMEVEMDKRKLAC